MRFQEDLFNSPFDFTHLHATHTGQAAAAMPLSSREAGGKVVRLRYTFVGVEIETESAKADCFHRDKKGRVHDYYVNGGLGWTGMKSRSCAWIFFKGEKRRMQ